MDTWIIMERVVVIDNYAYISNMLQTNVGEFFTFISFDIKGPFHEHMAPFL